MNDLNVNNFIENIESTIPEQQDDSLIIINIRLNDGTWIQKRLYKQVLELISEVVPVLEQEQSYTAETLCGEAFWKSLEKGEPIMAGKCVAQMVASKVLPLRFAGKTKSNSWLYQLK